MTETPRSAGVGHDGDIDMPEVLQTVSKLLERRSPARHRRRQGFRLAGALGLAVVTSGSALAATGVWNPLAAGGPKSYTDQQVPSQLLERLAVLREPQSERDTGPLISQFFEQQKPELAGEDETHIGSVRFLRDITTTLSSGHDGRIDRQTRAGQLFIVPKKQLTGQPVVSESEQPICAVTVRLTSGGRGDGTVDGATSCTPLSNFLTRGLVVESYGELHGLVPDGVALVRGYTAAGASVSSEVVRNSFELVSPARNDPAPDEGVTPAAANRFAGSLEWVDAAGEVVARVPF